jgi:hypothetical protein
MIPDAMLAFGASPIRKPKRKGIARIKSLIAAIIPFGKQQDLWKFISTKPSEAKRQELEEKFPEEAQMIELAIQAMLKSKNVNTRKLGANLNKDEKTRIWAILDLAIGNQPEPDDGFTADEAESLASKYEKGVEKASEEVVKSSLKRSDVLRKDSSLSRLRAKTYRAALRSLKKETRVLNMQKPGADPKPDKTEIATKKQASRILQFLIRGASRIGHLFDGARDEIFSAIAAKKPGPKNKKFPWPLHFDPETVISPLKRGRGKSAGVQMSAQYESYEEFPDLDSNQDASEKSEAEAKKGTSPTDRPETVMNRMVRVVKYRVRDRRLRTRELRLNPEMGMDGPSEPSMD